MRCYLVFVPRTHHLSPAEERVRYLLHDNTLENKGYVAMFERLFPHFESHWAGVRSVLDYGCGPGPVLVELLRRRGYDAVGYDPYFAPETPLDGTYDAVVSTETFEHFADVAREVTTITQLLPDGGYLVIMTRWLPDLDDWANWYYLREETHVTFFSGRTFDVIAGRFGYRICFRDGEQLVIMQKCMREPDGAPEAGRR